MKSVYVVLLIGAICIFWGAKLEAQTQLTREEVRQGWRLLFDGVSSQGWKSAQGQNFPERGWEIKDGELTVLAGGKGGDIVTVEQFSSFELALEFKLTPGANSGIKYFVQPGTSLGLEYQILDDERHPDAKQGVCGNRTLASLYDLIPAENKQVRPIGEWNQARIVVNGSLVEHWLNGVKVVSFDRFSQCFRALVQKSKYQNIEGFGQQERGHILLQDHGDTVSFRNIKIRPL
ncbi:MAG: DUF1080 domain-containing protein [candidate division KSB1 bacterium]|nr:DUF1080 domain-containing protein [candidate division KSB1 bacterium]MDZ7335925.1 DUF1080 domain-containing protein [candidate division KSB1 bacterium]MDZ7356786.1 DUF1080 domain-containing protein [candidate division KSB1 bacterium]MDZ7375016.1 DUF1080 domain-containing protein [candidate division KSB1 bacterium]MDZ7401255.1 DUF1080 domain-containing protein [candidate division KSB1 bacterium]